MADIKEIDSSTITPRELNKKIRLINNEYDKIVIKNPGAEHNLVAGIVGEGNIVIDGSAGYFAGTMLDKAKINGNAGWFVGDNMTSGEIIVEGSAGDGAGQGIYGGTLVVKKGVGSRTGEIMKGGTIIIGGDSGFMSGIFMMGGRMIILGNLGADAAESILRGEIFVLGEIESLGKNAITIDLTDEDKKCLKKLLTEYDFNLSDDNYNNFTKIVAESSRPLHGLE
ncbi:tributyrin esterase [uncultured Methanobrevibacter sp.]|uniref:GltB/FmdC/FwdC-like GXGXG domain-containing protein n=1 Tax=uncultured Methanobrevibacter sp. TaxID=253161 RepID=UPI0025EA4489|nr:tributyrin esterase [uncultured Methanobrevibacter sp.]